MHGRNVRFSQLRWLQSFVGLAAIVAALVLMGLGIAGYGSSVRLWMVVAGGFLLFLASIFLSVIPLLLKMESTSARQLTELRDLREIALKQTTALNSIAENSRVSDMAKSLAHRAEELELLHSAVWDATRNEQWETALRLVDEIEERLGFSAEAERFREELDLARNDAIQTKLTEAIDLIETHFKAHEWTLALSEIDRLKQALPGDPKVLSLQDRMRVLKQEHKEELMQTWDDAVRRNDTDQAIDVLKELDQYLSPAEAAALQSSARDVFKEKLLQLGVQFRFAVTEKRWSDALSTGLELVREFPNARMAGEVRDVLETLRERARQAAVRTEPAATRATPS